MGVAGGGEGWGRGGVAGRKGRQARQTHPSWVAPSVPPPPRPLDYHETCESFLLVMV